MDLSTIALAALALGGGATISWLVSRASMRELRARLVALQAAAQQAEDRYARELQALRAELEAARADRNAAAEARAHLAASLDAEQRAAAEKLALLEKAQHDLQLAFEAVGQRALQANSEAFLNLAQTKLSELHQSASGDLETRRKAIDDLVKPLHDELAHVGESLAKFNLDRAESHAGLRQQLESMLRQQDTLAAETQNLVKALRAPQVRGRWGELQLRRVVELAGMEQNADFTEQLTVRTEGGRLRPDLVVRLPGRKIIVVDSKAPLEAFLDAAECGDDGQREQLLDRHARLVRDHISALGSKDYAREFTEAPDFVVMFLPGETFFSEACRRDPNLIEFAVGVGVIPASPTTLITLLKAVAYGWQQQRLSQNAEKLRDLGIELYERLRKVGEHFDGIRRGLENAVEAYNRGVGSFESRVLPTARRFRELDAGPGDAIAELEAIDTMPRKLIAPELADPGNDPPLVS